VYSDIFIALLIYICLRIAFPEYVKVNELTVLWTLIYVFNTYVWTVLVFSEINVWTDKVNVK